MWDTGSQRRIWHSGPKEAEEVGLNRERRYRCPTVKVCLSLTIKQPNVLLFTGDTVWAQCDGFLHSTVKRSGKFSYIFTLSSLQFHFILVVFTINSVTTWLQSNCTEITNKTDFEFTDQFTISHLWLDCHRHTHVRDSL